MRVKRSKFWMISQAAMILITIFTHWIVFYFILINSFKTKMEASKLSLEWPSEWNIIENYKYIWNYNNHIFLKAFRNTMVITISSMVILVLVASMAAFILQRRGGRLTRMSDKLVLAGLIAPMSIIPTYWVLSKLQLANTLPGLILVEVALLFPYATMLYKGYIASLPREIDEAAVCDGCGAWSLFFRIEFSLLKPITATVLILRTVVVYNDFVNPMYFLAGSKSTTLQLCIYTFQNAFTTDWSHLFAAVVLVSIPPLVAFILLHGKIMEGMTMGAVKG